MCVNCFVSKLNDGTRCPEQEEEMLRGIEPPLDPPEPCDHDEDARFCETCEEERQYAEDMWADWEIERRKLGE